MGVKFSNNGHSTLAASAASNATSITVASGHGARFPSLSSGEFFYATLIDSSNNLEIVKCTSRSSDVLTVTRAQESTTARAYAIGDRVELRVTAAGLADHIDLDNVVADDSITAAKLNISGNGTAGQSVISDGDGSFSYGDAGGVLKSVQVFTSSGTYTKPSGVSTVKVTVTVAGGGGGAYGAVADRGAGGGAGGTAIEIIDISGVSTVTVNVGGGGAGGAAGSNNGAGGGGSSFGSYCTGNGGGGGKHGNAGPAIGGTGGGATGGDINITGGHGNNGIDNGYVAGGTNYVSAYGIGGASFWGGGGRGGSHNVGAHVGEAYGSGGGGGSNSNSGPGAGGAGGIIVVEEYS